MPEKKIKWTGDQLNAINSDGTVIVSAAAGSGKTAVLAEHVLKMITGDKNIDVDRLLVLTFTRDAAAEMKRRIQEKLDGLIVSEGATAQLLRQKQKLYSAHISTTDSFCSSLVREHFSVLNIEPDFRIASDDEIMTISNKALDTAFESFYAANSPDFRSLLRSFASGGDDSGLREAVLTVHKFLQNQPFRTQWLDEMVKRYTVMPFCQTEWAQEILRSLPEELDSMLSDITAAINTNKLTPALEEILLPLLEKDGRSIIELRNGLESGGYGEYCERAKTLFGTDYEENPEISEKLQKNKKTPIKNIFGCRAQIRTKVQSYIGADEEIEELSGQMVTLSELVSAFDRELAVLKDRRNIRTFSDVSALTVKLLAENCKADEAEFCTGGFYYKRTELAKELSSRFAQVIVDEYQDVNLIQEVIYNCISSGGDNLFMVGDIKQSIYGFRQSKAKLFNERKNRYAPFDKANPSYPATIYLSENFRSCQQVCETVNYIFSRIMADYKPEEYLNFGAEGYVRDPKRDTEISLIYHDKIDESSSVTALEARYTAGRILDMINSGYTVHEKNGDRPLRYGDIAVLMRAKSAADSDDESKQKGSAEFVKQLGKYGIPAYCEESENFFDAREIKLVLNILRVIDNPSDDVALLSVLVSPVYGFTPDDLAVIRLGSGKASLYRSLNICREDDSDTGRKSARFLDELKRFRDLASVSTVDELLESVYERTAIIAVTTAVNGGAYPARNLDLMRVYARKFASNGYKTLSDFNGYIDRLLSNNRKLASASQVKGDAADCVQVMSIHKSKGLEFPICFLVDTAHKFNETDFRKHVMTDSEAYVGIRPMQNFVRTPTFPYRAITLKKRRENTDEEMRLLYVALTRAKEKLIIVGTDKNMDSSVKNAAAKTLKGEINPGDIYSCKRMLDWILFTAAVNPSTRALFDENRTPGESESNWLLHKIQTEKELFPFEEAQDGETDSEAQSADSRGYRSILEKNLSFEYPDSDIIGVPQKVNPSQVSHSENREYSGRALVIPAFAKDSAKLSPTEIGTAHHEFLHYCDFVAARDDLEAEINRLLKTEKLTQRQCDCLDREKLAAILQNPLFERVLSVPESNVYREKQFTVFVHPSLICEGEFKSDRRQIVDGEVDLVFIENGELVIVDYKTDRVRDVEELRRHKPQLDLYEEAMKQVLGLPVKEKIIFSITLNQSVSV